MPLIIAFGTLKRGFPLHDRGLAGATYLGAYVTARPHPLVIAGPWFTPMMFDRPGEGLPVQGELYAVDDNRLATLDRLESVGIPGNFRRLVRILPVAGGPEISAWAFMKSPDLAEPVHSGFLASYDDRRFIPPHARP
jgi:gamma-glutamylaminecyclotransferase